MTIDACKSEVNFYTYIKVAECNMEIKQATNKNHE